VSNLGCITALKPLTEPGRAEDVKDLTADQLAFIARVGGDPDEVLRGAAGAVFVYVEEPNQTVRYELTERGEPRHVDTFRAGSAPS
jgi:hypothetical protein